jgi:hypothetical protein
MIQNNNIFQIKYYLEKPFVIAKLAEAENRVLLFIIEFSVATKN